MAANHSSRNSEPAQQQQFPTQCICPTQLKESVLTIDGGGMRGYSCLIILRELMDEIRQYEHEKDKDSLRDQPGHANSVDNGSGKIDQDPPLPCHYFNYMLGTSTGGIIAVLLGRLRMSVAQCMTVYEELGTDVFRRLRPLRFTQYSHRKLEQAILRTIRQHCNDHGDTVPSDRALRDPANDGGSFFSKCRVGVVATRRGDRSHRLHLFRSYYNPSQGNETAANTYHHLEDETRWLNLTHQSSRTSPTILEAVRATSAAPHYFKRAKIDFVEYMDGGVLANNPSFIAFNEINAMHKELSPNHACRYATGGIRYMLSLGTGKGAPQNIFRDGNPLYKVFSIVGTAIQRLTDPEGEHTHMSTLCQGSPCEYKRFNVPNVPKSNSLEGIALDDCKIGRDGNNSTLREIARCTDAYLREYTIREDLRQLARNLVDHRRAKCIDPSYQGLTNPGPLADAYVRNFRNPLEFVPAPLRGGTPALGRNRSYLHDGYYGPAEMASVAESAELYTPSNNETPDGPTRNHTWG